MVKKGDLEFGEWHKAIFRGNGELAIGKAQVSKEGVIMFKTNGLIPKKVQLKATLNRDNKDNYEDYFQYDPDSKEIIDKIRLYNLSIVTNEDFTICSEKEKKILFENESLRNKNQYFLNTIENLVRTLDRHSIPDIEYRDLIQGVERAKKLNPYQGNFQNSGGSK